MSGSRLSAVGRRCLVIGRRLSVIGCALSVVGLLLFAAPARAELVPTYSSTTGFRYNPLGLFEQFQLRLTKQLSDRKDPLFAGTYARGEATLFVSPATLGIGLGTTVQPINILRLSASYTPLHYWGNFDILQSFPTPNADYRPSTSADRPSYGQTVHQFNVAAMLQMKIGNVAVRSETTGSYVHTNLRNGDTVYYDFVWDIPAPKRGWVIENDSDVLWLVDNRLTLGVRNTLITVLYPDWVLRGAPLDPRVLPTDRVGPVVAYKVGTSTTGLFREPTLFLSLQWYIASRYRTGDDVSRAVPYLLTGINFQGW